MQNCSLIRSSISSPFLTEGGTILPVPFYNAYVVFYGLIMSHGWNFKPCALRLRASQRLILLNGSPL